MRGFGAIVSFEVADAQAADLLTADLELIVGGTSLGGVETTIDRRNRWPGEEHIPPGLLRLSVGLEHPDDLWADLQDALSRISPGQSAHASQRSGDQAASPDTADPSPRTGHGTARVGAVTLTVPPGSRL